MFDKKSSIIQRTPGGAGGNGANNGNNSSGHSENSSQPSITRICSATGGALPMSIEGRMRYVRERLTNMTPEERMWRAQWLQDQILDPNEPRYVEEYYKKMRNPIRRFYRWPLDKMFEKLQPVMGLAKAAMVRALTGKILIGIASCYAFYYHIKYNGNEWERPHCWNYVGSRKAVYPGDPGFPYVPELKHPWDYDTSTFRDRKCFRYGLY